MCPYCKDDPTIRKENGLDADGHDVCNQRLEGIRSRITSGKLAQLKEQLVHSQVIDVAGPSGRRYMVAIPKN